MRRTVFALILVSLVNGCLLPDSPVLPVASRTGGGVPLISDGRHGDGNPHFFFLAPIVAHPGTTGVFDPTLNPIVQVCVWSTVCEEVVARFSRSTGNGGETIQVSETEYRVNWKTSECLSGPCALDPSKRYRLSVEVSGVQLGFADLDVVANGSQLKNVETGEFIGLVEGKTLPVRFRIEEGAIDVVPSQGGAATITPSVGGTVATEDGNVVIEIPPGALSGTSPVEITVTPAPAGAPEDESMIPGSVVEFGPDGITFEKPVTIRLAYDPARIPSGVPERHLRLHTYDESAGRWMPVDGTTVDELRNTVRADVRHFSEYGAGELPPPEQIRWWGTYPAPEWGNSLPEIAGGQIFVIQVENIGPQGSLPTPAGDGRPGWPWLAALPVWGGAFEDLTCIPDPIYESANPTVVTVDSVAVIDIYSAWELCNTSQPVIRFTPRAFGSTYLRATVNGYVDSVKIVVTGIQALDISYPFFAGVNPSYSLAPGESVEPTVHVQAYSSVLTPLPNKVVQWTTDIPSIVQIAPTGNQSATITGVAPGCAWIKTTVDDTVSNRFSTIVRPKPVDLVVAGLNISSLYTTTSSGCGAEHVEGSIESRFNNESITHFVRWSPDGSKIAWIGAPNGAGPARVHIAAWNGVGGAPLPTFGSATHFSWSPDGSQVVYAAQNLTYGTIEIRIINSDGTGDRVLIPPTNVPSPSEQVLADAPEWSPDGSRIAFHRGLRWFQSPSPATTRRDTRSVYTIRPDGTDEQLIIPNAGGFSPGFPLWSPNGDKLLYLEYVNGTSQRFSVANADGSNPQVLYAIPTGITPGFDQFDRWGLFDWAPSGAHVRLGSYVMNPDGSGVVNLLMSTNANVVALRFSWSSDGQQLAYASNGAMYRINANGTGRVLLTRPDFFDHGFQAVWHVFWRPTSPSVP
jgi:hypothetical protein